MFSSFSVQTTLFLQSCVLGVLFGANYDIFRAIRREFRLKFIGVFLCDTFFWIINLLAFLIFVLNLANGEGRMYIIFAIILGSILYFLSFGAIFLKFFRLIFRYVRRIWTALKKILKKIKNF